MIELFEVFLPMIILFIDDIVFIDLFLYQCLADGGFRVAFLFLVSSFTEL